MYQRISGLIGWSASILLAGCGSMPQHSNTLMFSTNTKVALDISFSAMNAGTPSATLGYKRRESVWMPLWANAIGGKQAQSCQKGADDENANDCKFIGRDGQGKNSDTYSVLASFGADLDNTADGAGVKSQNGLAQYFATGLAARELAKEGGAQLVNVNAKPAQPESPLPTIDEAYGLVKACVLNAGKFNSDNWNKVVYRSDIGNTAPHSDINQDNINDWLDALRDSDNSDLILLAKSARSVCES